jgi:hypothetical protein
VSWVEIYNTGFFNRNHKEIEIKMFKSGKIVMFHMAPALKDPCHQNRQKQSLKECTTVKTTTKYIVWVKKEK